MERFGTAALGRGDWEPRQGAGAKNQTAELGLEAAEDPAVFCELSAVFNDRSTYFLQLRGRNRKWVLA